MSQPDADLPVPALVEEIVRARLEIMRLVGDAPTASLHSPATSEQVDELERRFGSPLPPTYRGFLSFTDGVLEFASEFDLLGVRQMLAPGYEKDLKRIRKVAWDAGHPIEGWIVGLREGSPEVVYLDRSHPTVAHECRVVYWRYEPLSEAPSFQAFLAEWLDITREVLRKAR